MGKAVNPERQSETVVEVVGPNTSVQIALFLPNFSRGDADRVSVNLAMFLPIVATAVERSLLKASETCYVDFEFFRDL